MTIPEAVIPIEPKKKTGPALIILLAIGAVIVVCLAVVFLRPSTGGGNVKACTQLTVTKCQLEKYNNYVFGTVKNTCNTKISALKLVLGAYTADGTLLYEDDEYVQDLAPGQQKTFESPLGSPAEQGESCKGRVDSGY